MIIARRFQGDSDLNLKHLQHSCYQDVVADWANAVAERYFYGEVLQSSQGNCVL